MNALIGLIGLAVIALLGWAVAELKYKTIIFTHSEEEAEEAELLENERQGAWLPRDEHQGHNPHQQHQGLRRRLTRRDRAIHHSGACSGRLRHLCASAPTSFRKASPQVPRLPLRWLPPMGELREKEEKVR